ncbi:MAG: hypothetical protein IPL78_23450 [Chloroflexi bacterium]|nr:hypothetical protein [Chloroflexota bacterium]
MVAHAHLIGRQHRLIQHNGQDFAITGPLPGGGCFGLVLDGCGSKWRTMGEPATPSSNEVGAKLLGAFAAATIPHLLTTTSVHDLPQALASASLDYLRRLVAAMPLADESDLIRFVHTHWLCTFVGFVKTDAAACFFWSGDGYLLHDDTVIHLDSGNQPDYLAYRLLRNGPEPLVHTLILPEPTHLTRLAVATDGWNEALLTDVAAAPRSPLALQRWLNQQAQQRGNFEDDGAIAIWYGNDE